ncbi:hypothetical protein SAMN04515695_0172 [Pseudovibrio sp. Tun.PSC04-5.I4]|nr:hypothetical protein SAMN04515695_0172 [Pseudovibrio sp. Tun.PSC04-5.I4]
MQHGLVAGVVNSLKHAQTRKFRSWDCFERGPAEFGYCVENANANLCFGPLIVKGACLQFVADDLLPASHLRFNSRALIVACLFLPTEAPFVFDRKNMFISR